MKPDYRRWRGGESRLASHQCGPGSNPGINAMYGLSLLSFSLLFREVLYRTLRFSLPLKYVPDFFAGIGTMGPARTQNTLNTTGLILICFAVAAVIGHQD